MARTHEAEDEKTPETVVPEPPYRKLRGYALDPSLVTQLNLRRIGEVTFRIPWQKLEPGPVDEYLEVVDTDPASGCWYEPVDLDAPALLAQDGLPPSEGTPQFHQQMAFAVARLTIQNFEHALGRRTLWRPRPMPDNIFDDSHFVRRLRVYPHALREGNAYYTPQRVALLFGYFKASADSPGDHPAGAMVFACLSHDIVAHETTHALLDGMNRNFLNPSNPDVHAFHEAFADIVAVFQHFTFPEILRHQIAATQGDIDSQENMLGQLAEQFGRSTGGRSPLRDFIGQTVNGEWEAAKPNPADYLAKDATTEPHARGSILVAAVFAAFLAIYRHRTADLLRLATEGRGILPPGAIPPDLVNRLAEEAAKAARHVLTMCVRAIDYCPPVDITFGEFLRAVITADSDLVPDDDLNYRTAFLQAFRERGLYPKDVRTLSVESLRWRTPDEEEPELRPTPMLKRGLRELRGYASDALYTTSREQLFKWEREMRKQIHLKLKDCFAAAGGAQDAAYLGVDLERPFEVRTARVALRTSPDGGVKPQLLVVLYQSREVPLEPAAPNGPQMVVEGGSTIVADLRETRIHYCVRKPLNSSDNRVKAQQTAFAAGTSPAALRMTYFGTGPVAEPIAAIHRAQC